MVARLRTLCFGALAVSLSAQAACGPKLPGSDDTKGAPDAGSIDATAETCDPAAWRSETLPDDQFANVDVRGMDGTAVDDVWAVTSTGRVLHRDAVGWTQTEPLAGPLEAVWAADRQTAWMVGRFGFIARWSGSDWVTERRGDEPNNDVAVLADVHGASPGEVWAVGSLALGGPAVLRRDSTGWSPVLPPPTARGLRAVWAVAPGHVWVAGDDGLFELENDTWTMRTASTSFRDVVVLPDGELWALKSASSHDDALCHALVGLGGCVPFPGGSVVVGSAFAITGGAILAVASDAASGSILEAELQGTGWTGGTTAEPGVPFSVWGTSGNTWIGLSEKILRRGCD